MTTETEVIIVGTGTAGLAAAREVKKVTDNFVIASNGVYGTTCVRAGCMPAKALIHGAQLCHSRHMMQDWGIGGAEKLALDIPALLRHVRDLRSHFLNHTLKMTEQYRSHIVEGKVWFSAPNEIRINGHLFKAKNIILATGSLPIIPDICAGHNGTILTTDSLFEQEDLPRAIGVMGLSVLGAEIAQAFAHLGIEVTASHEDELIGGLSDPVISDAAVTYLRREMDIHLNEPGCMSQDTLFIARSRKANLGNMGLEALGIIQPGMPVADYDAETMQVGDLPLYIAGDVKSGRSILNEAVHEGQIAGYNAAHETKKRFKRRVPLQIVHTNPVIAVAGKSWSELQPENSVIGSASYDDQGCAKVINQAYGKMHLYADKESHILLGAEMFAPGGDHLAHLLASFISRQATVEEILKTPFYHPSLEEGVKSALQDIAS